MVMRLLSFILLFPIFLFSGEFIASVDRNQVEVGEGFFLNLTLKNASTHGTPLLNELKESFVVHSQHQTSNTMIVNGNVTSSLTWKIALTTDKEGESFIPAIKINTSAGILSSNPIKVSVVKESPETKNSSKGLGVIFTADVSHAKPYKNEPFFLTLKLISKHPLANVTMQKFHLSDAIVQQNEAAKTYEKVIEGIKVNVIELSYLITPLKSESLIIPPITIQGSISSQNKGKSAISGAFGSLFHFPGFEPLKPFSISTEELILDVHPPVPGITPWLPAKSLAINEILDETQNFQVGNPITRSFEIRAEGVTASQLPCLNFHSSSPHVKIYADKPEIGETIENENIHSFRKESYTLIPQESGDLKLPEIFITWWDVTKNQKAIAQIPARILSVLPDNEPSFDQVAMLEENLYVNSAESETVSMKDILLYTLIASFGVLLLAALLWAITLQKRIARLTENPQKDEVKSEVSVIHKEEKKKSPSITRKKPPAKDKKEKLPDLNPT